MKKTPAYHSKKVEDEETIISKSELKRQMHRLQAMGEGLLDLPDFQLKSLTIGDELLEAIELAKTMRSDNGRRRQLQRIGKLMRHEDLENITLELEKSKQAKAPKHKTFPDNTDKTEDLCKKLLANDKNALTELIEAFPHTNRQLMRQLVKNAQKEQSILLGQEEPKALTKTSKKHYQRLFQEVSTTVNQ